MPGWLLPNILRTRASYSSIYAENTQIKGLASNFFFFLQRNDHLRFTKRAAQPRGLKPTLRARHQRAGPSEPTPLSGAGPAPVSLQRRAVRGQALGAVLGRQERPGRDREEGDCGGVL